ncbi:electron transport complex subunit RsxC [Thalassomonas haliotis]|uniref:Ion-translocating oxidoreductase complex subunit C n=1 Tax=Thalassomonas haliotis TaxID=485448 RepID=A0ABY7VAP3_9GAMM|nr:electron transport complex subunit RsxC [Thalassomonas haliotis]WDE10365.1 electron transport complex subunit RsxC [Thalassomonas haliotis]
MESVIERIERGHFWKFHGGIHPPEQKFLTNDKPIRHLPLPKQLIIPVRQHIGNGGELLVAVGDKVLKGQPLTQNSAPMTLPVHAPTSGTITDIKDSVVAHPSGLSELCVFIAPDGEDRWRERQVCDDFHELSRQEIVKKIARAGIAGMGGAGFPTHIKVNNKPEINYLIINAAECEPYITADDLLIREHSEAIVDGIKILDHLLLPAFILIGIEDNKPEAIEALRQATKNYDKVKLCVIPTKYPAGGEKQLIKVLTGQEVPSGILPISLGIVMQNIATCFAIAEAVLNDTPLIRRVVTVSGRALSKPRNVWALLGTPVEYLLEQCGYQGGKRRHLIMGGPMMGFSLPSTQVPIVKITNCLLAPEESEIPADNKEVECIRCGQCAEVCPSQLLPQELQWSAKAKDYPQLQKLNLFDCIDCGACAYVCPSQIPLVQYYRVAKAEIRQLQVQELKAEKAKDRFEARKARLEREKKAREEKHKKAAEARRAAMNKPTEEAQSAKSAVAAALARVKAKKAQAGNEATGKSDEVNTNTATPAVSSQVAEQKSQVAAAIARAKAKKQAAKAEQKQEQEQAPEQVLTPATEPAKEKAERQSQAEASEERDNGESAEDKPLDKKQKIAAAIARAKAKKLSAQKSAEPAPEPIDASTPSDLGQPPKEPAKTTDAAVDSAQASEPVDSAGSSKQDKIQAAVAKAKEKARAKAKAKAKSAPEAEVGSDEQNLDSETEQAPGTSDGEAAEQQESSTVDSGQAPQDEKAQRIAAAVSKAKAKAKAKAEAKAKEKAKAAAEAKEQQHLESE